MHAQYRRNRRVDSVPRLKLGSDDGQPWQFWLVTYVHVVDGTKASVVGDGDQRDGAVTLTLRGNIIAI